MSISAEVPIRKVAVELGIDVFQTGIEICYGKLVRKRNGIPRVAHRGARKIPSDFCSPRLPEDVRTDRIEIRPLCIDNDRDGGLNLGLPDVDSGLKRVLRSSAETDVVDDDGR